MNTVEQMLAKELNLQYSKMRDAGGSKEFSLQITAHVSGYGNEGMLVKYHIGGYSDTDKVEGSSIETVIREYMRRKNWTENNKPMVLIGSQSIDNDPQPDTDNRESVNDQ